MSILYPQYATTLGIEQLSVNFLPPLDAEPIQAYVDGPRPSRGVIAAARQNLDASAVAGTYSYYLNENSSPEDPYCLRHLETGAALMWLLLDKGGALTDLPSQADFERAQRRPNSSETRNQQTYATALEQLLSARSQYVFSHSGRTYDSGMAPQTAERQLNNATTTILTRAGIGINDVFNLIYRHANLTITPTEARCGAAIVSLATGYVLEQSMPRKPALPTMTLQTMVIPR